MSRVNRADLLQALEAVLPGLSPREIVEQSSCFVFKDGKVMTFNEEICCIHKAPLKITGAVQAMPLLNILRKLPEDDVNIEIGKGHLIIDGKKRRAGVVMEAEVLLQVDLVEKPKKWLPLKESFSDAIHIVGQCVGSDESQFFTTCIHITPKWIEACDNDQLTRYRIKTKIEGEILVKGASIRHIVDLDMTEFCVTESWLHFRNPAGLVFSCRRYTEEGYKNLTKLLVMEDGRPIVLPKGLVGAVDKAEVFSSENADDNQVLVELRPGKVRIKGRGVSGFYQEVKSLKYEGESMSFMISPDMLVELTKRQSNCEIAADRLRVNGGKFVYVASLVKAEDKSNGEGEEEGGSKGRKGRRAVAGV